MEGTRPPYTAALVDQVLNRAARRRLLTGHERLRPETFAKMWNPLIDTGDAGVLIL